MLKINSIQSVSLDFIRLFAVQAVLIGHSISFFGVANDIPYIQNMGVVLFFVLSGLIISYTVFYKSQAEYSFGEFFVERFARIYSGLLPSLVVIVLIDLFLRHYHPQHYSYSEAYNIKTFIGNIFMLQDYQYIGHYFAKMIPEELHITSFGSGRPLWTLAIEWWLYMFFGLLYFFYKKSFSWKYFPLLVLFSLVPLWNLIYGRGHGLSIFWIFGIVITLLVFKKQEVSKGLSFSLAFLFFIFSIVILLYSKEAYNLNFVFFIAGFIFFTLLYQQNNTKQYNNNFVKAIKFGAAYSFTLYLVHYSIIELIISLDLNYNKYVMVVIVVIVSNIIALSIAMVTEMKHKEVAQKIKGRMNYA